MPVIRPCVLNVNKPLNWTSRDVLNKLQKIYKFKKFGHAGTLDPLATGVLLVLVGSHTKKQSYYMGLPKEYKVRIFFGLYSPTLDLEGPLKYVPLKKPISTNNIKRYLDSKLGEHPQKVPFYSAVKVKGDPLYKIARKNKTTKIPSKKVILYNYKILDFKNQNPKKDYLQDINGLDYKKKLYILRNSLPYVDLWLKTGKGYYVRSLARDLGEFLKTSAVVGSLQRVAVGDFNVKDSLSLKYFESQPDLIY